MVRLQDKQGGGACHAQKGVGIGLIGGIRTVFTILIFFWVVWLIRSADQVDAPVYAREETRLAPSGGPAVCIPTGYTDLIAYLGNDGNVYTIAPDGSGRTQVTRDASDDLPRRVTYQDLAWSPDGKYLSFTRLSPDSSTTPLTYLPVALIYQPESTKLRQVDLLGRFQSLIWTADSSGLLYGREINWGNTGKPTDPIYGVWKYDLATGQSGEVVPPVHRDPLAVRSVSPDGRYISFDEVMYLDARGSFGYYNKQTKTYQAWDQSGDLRPGSVDWSPDGQSLIFDRIDYGIRPGSQIWKADPNFKRVVALTPSNRNFSAFLPRYAPTGDQIAYFYQQGQFTHPAELWVMNGDGSSRHRVASGEGLVSFTWAPDGKRLAYAYKQGRTYSVMVGDAAGVQSKAISDGRWPAWRPKGPGS